jgi:hypothetical protein
VSASVIIAQLYVQMTEALKGLLFSHPLVTGGTKGLGSPSAFSYGSIHVK